MTPPISWKLMPLGDVCLKITKGTTPTTIGGRFTDDGIKFIKVETISEFGSLEEAKLAFIDEESHEMLKRSQLEANDVLFSIAGAIGRTYLVKEQDIPANTNQALAIVRFNQDVVLPSYGFYALRAPYFQSQAFGRIIQCAQANVNLTQLSMSKIFIPPKIQQEQIVKILFAYDSLIENNRRRIQLLGQSARLLYMEWFVHLRFPGHEHVGIIDGVPKGWRKKKLQEVADINAISLNNGFQEKIEYIDISSVTTGQINETTLYEFKDAPGRARRLVRHGDIIWSCVRPNRESHAIIWNPHKNLIASTGFAVISPIEAPTSYIYQALTTKEFVGYLTNNARGVAYPAVTGKDFESADILIPTNSLLEQFDGTVKATIEQINVRLCENYRKTPYIS